VSPLAFEERIVASRSAALVAMTDRSPVAVTSLLSMVAVALARTRLVAACPPTASTEPLP